MRAILSLVLSLCLILSGLAAASARGAMAGTLELVICTGYGPQTLILNSKGDPVPQADPCPDCTLTLAAPLPVPPQALTPTRTPRSLTWAHLNTPSLQRHFAAFAARAPPIRA